MKWPFQKTVQQEVKQNPVGGALFDMSPLGYSRKDKKVLADEGYKQNVVVYRAIREITTGVASVNLRVKVNGEMVDKHPVLDLLNSPNPMQGYDQFIVNLFSDYLITGEAFVSRYPLSSNKPPAELWALSPLKMSVKAGLKGVPASYIYNESGKNEKVFPVKGLDLKSDVFFLKTYNPTDYWRGLAPLEAAALAGDTHNAGMQWNYSLLKNGARPSGIVEFAESPSSEVIGRLKEFFKKQMQGTRNAGEIPILTGGAKWTATDTSPRDMDYINTMKEMSKYVASAFGVPLPLIDNDAASYNNIEQAKERLWTDTIIPLLDEFLTAFSTWLSGYYDQPFQLCADLDTIPALEGIRNKKYERIRENVKVGIMTIDEARATLGLPEMGGLASALLVPSSMIPLDFSASDQDLKKSMQLLGYSQKEINEALDNGKA